jgi:hypothetical protein
VPAATAHEVIMNSHDLGAAMMIGCVVAHAFAGTVRQHDGDAACLASHMLSESSYVVSLPSESSYVVSLPPAWPPGSAQL